MSRQYLDDRFHVVMDPKTCQLSVCSQFSAPKLHTLRIERHEVPVLNFFVIDCLYHCTDVQWLLFSAFSMAVTAVYAQAPFIPRPVANQSEIFPHSCCSFNTRIWRRRFHRLYRHFRRSRGWRWQRHPRDRRFMRWCQHVWQTLKGVPWRENLHLLNFWALPYMMHNAESPSCKTF